MGSNRELIGKQYPTIDFAFTAQRAHAYAAATDDHNPAYATGKLGCPMAVVMASIPHGAGQVVADADLVGDPMRLLRLLHSEEDITWHGSLRPDTPWRVTPTLRDIRENSIGEVLLVHTRIAGIDGTCLAEVLTSLLIREKRPGTTVRRKDLPTADAVPDAPWAHTWTVAPDQSERYAEASGDHNPIHLDAAVAKSVGLKSRILHGLCTAAFAQRAVVATVAQGDPKALHRLCVRFSKPVFMGDTLTWFGWDGGTEGGRRVVKFVVQNADGGQVITQGRAELG